MRFIKRGLSGAVSMYSLRVKLLKYREQFSGITLIEVLEHIDDPSSFLREIYRICKDSGFFIVTIPNGYSIKEMLTAVVHGSANRSHFLTKCIKWFRKIAKRDDAYNESQHVQWFALKRIRGMLEEPGLQFKKRPIIESGRLYCGCVFPGSKFQDVSNDLKNGWNVMCRLT